MLHLTKFLDQAWERARGSLRDDLDHLEAAFNKLINFRGETGTFSGALTTKTLDVGNGTEVRTASTSETLHVAGDATFDLASTGGLVVAQSADARFMVKSTAASAAVVRVISNNTAYASIDSMDAAFAVTKDLALNPNGGSVGIGVTTPGTRLDLGAGAITLLEMTAPGAGSANTCRLYAVDNGAGKTQLMAIFASGVAQQLAIEP